MHWLNLAWVDKMYHHLLFRLLSIALLLMTSSCGPRLGRMDVAQLDPRQLVVDLPAIYIDYDSTGQARIAGRSLLEIGEMFNFDLSDLTLEPGQIALLTAANIQHIQINNTEQGLLLSVNGELIPSLRWDGSVLQSTAETLQLFHVPIPTIVEELLPLVTKLGVSVVVRFPLLEGTPPIPLAVNGVDSAAAQARKEEKTLRQNSRVPEQLTFIIDYALDGTWTLNRRPVQEWNSLVPFDLQGLNLAPNTVRDAARAGIKNITFSSNPVGVSISINGNPLPQITWGNGEIQHAVRLAQETGLLDLLSDAIADLPQLLEQLLAVLPMAQQVDFRLSINFPPAE